MQTGIRVGSRSAVSQAEAAPHAGGRKRHDGGQAGVDWWQVPTKKREPANVEEKEMQYLYKEGGDLVFMDPSNHAQVAVSKELIGDATDLMKDNLPCRMSFFNESPVDVTLPTFVQLDVLATEAGGDGNAAAGDVTRLRVDDRWPAWLERQEEREDRNGGDPRRRAAPAGRARRAWTRAPRAVFPAATVVCTRARVPGR